MSLLDQIASDDELVDDADEIDPALLKVST